MMRTPFVLLTTQRTGATVLLRALSRHPDVSVDSTSLFTQDTWLRFFSRDRAGSSFRRYRTAGPRRRIEFWLSRRSLVVSFLDSHIERQSNDGPVTGLKVSYNHIDRYPAIADWMRSRQTPVIHLVRQNGLKMLLSEEASKRRGVSHSEMPLPAVTVEVDPDRLARRLARKSRAVERHRRLLRDMDNIEITYEELYADWEASTLRLTGWLGLQPPRPLPPPDLAKLNPDSVSALLENYSEVAERLHGTPFEHCLDSQPLQDSQR